MYSLNYRRRVTRRFQKVLPKVIQLHPPHLQPSGFSCLPARSVAASFCVYLHESEFFGGLSHTNLINVSLETEESRGQARPFTDTGPYLSLFFPLLTSGHLCPPPLPLPKLRLFNGNSLWLEETIVCVCVCRWWVTWVTSGKSSLSLEVNRAFAA